PSSRSLDDGNNPARHLKRPHQPGASRRDPARPALPSRRNTQVPANAPTHAFRQDRDRSSEIRVRPDPDPEAARRKTSLTTPPPAASPPRSCHHHARLKTEIPIDRRRTPAGSCLGGFRTPDGIRKPSPTPPPARRTGDPESSHSLTGATDGSAPLQDIQSQGATSPNRIFSLTACVDHERPGRQYRFNLLEQEESFLATRHQGSRARVHDRDALSTSA